MIIPGDSSELPDDFFRVVVFIDNAYLIRLKNYFFKRKLKYNLKYLIFNISKKSNLFVEKIFILKDLGMSVFLWTYFERVRDSPFSKNNHLIKSVTKYYKLTRDDFLKVENK